MTYRRATYPEILDALLTSLTGGVAAEEHAYPPEGDQHYLLRPKAASLVSVYGARAGETRAFRLDKDVALIDGVALQWLEGGETPDPDTIIVVNYYPEVTLPLLTDIRTGSVVRTLLETVALEIGRLHAQVDAVYQAGFVDTATGDALDKVVALLGVDRVLGGRPAGEVVFSRAEGARGVITIPTGTRIITADGEIEYETTATVTMAEAQRSVRVRARDLEPNEGLPAGSLVVMPVPIAGVSSVDNPAPTVIETRSETDVELRTRAKNFLHGSERATLGALHNVLARQGFQADIKEFEQPGVIRVVPHADSLTPEQRQRLRTALNDAAPAGVKIVIGDALAPRRVNLQIQLTTDESLLDQDLRAAQQQVRDAVGAYFDSLDPEADASLNQLVGKMLAVSGVEDVTVLAATDATDATDLLDREAGVLKLAGQPAALGDLAVTDPALPATLDVVITHPEDAAAPDRAAVETALNAYLASRNQRNEQAFPEGLDPAATEAEIAARSLAFDTLIQATPLPGKDPQTLTPEQLAPYSLTYVVTQAAGLAQTLTAADDAYRPAVAERVVLGEVNLAVSS